MNQLVQQNRAELVLRELVNQSAGNQYHGSEQTAHSRRDRLLCQAKSKWPPNAGAPPGFLQQHTKAIGCFLRPPQV
jgi:hypothetical protein